MRRLLITGVWLVAAVAPARAQIFPGEPATSAAFPNAFGVSLLAATSADLRATRVFTDSAVGCVPCIRHHSMTGSLGLAVRMQLSTGRRTALRVGVAISGPKPKRSTPNGTQVVIDPNRLSVMRGEAMVLFRLKPHVPIYFGLGATFARFSPGPIPGQPELTEVGGVGAIGIDHQISKKVATRFEYLLYGTKPKDTGLSNEYSVPGTAFDGQFSFGVVLFFQPVVRPR